jgi:8-oxo-dGTP pyrophosphatase MutT (NUDIX family)
LHLSWLLTSRSVGQQCAALPLLRAEDGRVTVALVTSRGTKRWVLPKGWAKRGRPLHETAADEAQEEAGLIGRIGHEAIGRYTYRKRLHLLASMMCVVEVFPMEVSEQLQTWPEKAQRRVAFFAPVEAAGLVQEPELAELLRSIAQNAPRHPLV